MRTHQAQVKDAAIGVGVGATPECLSTIHKPGCAATIWRRQPAPGFQAWLDRLAPDELPSARLILQPGAVPSAVAQLCDMAALSPGAERSWLEQDVADLSTRFAASMDAPYLRLRLDVITTNACRKFHIDAITARLICTYRGTGTQYGISTDGAEPSRVFTVPTGCPMILRGTLWPETPKSGLLHRSPPIAGTGETRLVLVLDPVHNPDDNPH
mmetsp:Transcript_27452/g.50619  ORF Transcript_27452/g.50619 Transcript_27452/m.50619 type:complete len:213 (+) Transcript_27452:232-870(+)